MYMGVAMKSRNILGQIKFLNEQISEDLLEIARLRAELTDISAHCSSGGVHTGGNHDKIDKLVVRIIEMEERINHEIDVQYRLKNRVEVAMVNMRPRYQEIIRMRYFENKDIHGIALDLGLSDSSVKKSHKQALIELQVRI